jgi:hypothetical protein
MERNQRTSDAQRPATGDRQPSTAPDASFETGAGADDTGFDSPPDESHQLGNTEVRGSEHSEPVFPPDVPRQGGERD